EPKGEPAPGRLPSRRATLRGRCHDPPDVRVAVFQLPVLSEGEVAVAVRPNPCVCRSVQVHFVVAQERKGRGRRTDLTRLRRPSIDGTTYIPKDCGRRDISLREISFRTQYDYPLMHHSARHPGLQLPIL